MPRPTKAKQLKPEQIEEIRTLYAEGWTPQRIANKFGVHRTSVYFHTGKNGFKKRGKDLKPRIKDQYTRNPNFLPEGQGIKSKGEIKAGYSDQGVFYKKARKKQEPLIYLRDEKGNMLYDKKGNPKIIHKIKNRRKFLKWRKEYGIIS